MPIDEAASASYRWLAKQVFESKLLDDMEDLARWIHSGPGQMGLAAQRSRDGQHSLRLVCPTVTERPNVRAGRPHGDAVLRRVVPGEDWSRFNRISIWVYPDMPGFHIGSVVLRLNNDGKEKLPGMWTHGPMHYALVKPGQWNHIVWEIAHLTRDRVTGLDLIYRLQGNEPQAASLVSFDWDHLELQRVEADYYEGWSVWPGRIAFSHSGYELTGPKTALASNLKAQRFELIDNNTGKAVLDRPVQSVQTRLGEFQILDFSELRQPGHYLLRAGQLVTAPFRVERDIWTGTIWKTINFFYCERCGDRIEGIHDVCHQDWQAEHNGRRIVINGGWHDAGDLSQGLINTGEATYAMFSLAEAVRERDPVLSRRLIEEAKWGLAWLHRTRFGDGFRVTWATMDYWTDNKIGTADDTFGQVRDAPADNAVGAAASAIASRLLSVSDPDLARASLQIAREDWEFALRKLADPSVETLGAAVLACVELYRATGQQLYADKAVELASLLLQAQQRTYPDWEIPLAGFFYSRPMRDRILNYPHRAHYQAPVVALAELCRALPDHPDWSQWYGAVAIHAEYLRAAADFQQPYRLLPAGIYRLSDNPGQVSNGLKLSETHYLRRFPVWGDMRGHFGVLLSHAKSLSASARLRNRPELLDLCQLQLQWVVGRNPFAQSTMYGEGYDYAPQYTAMSGNMVGSLPVGIQTRYDLDVPYWPVTNCWNYKEVWVHPSSRWLFIMADLMAPGTTHRPVQLELSGQQEDATVRISAAVRGSGRHELVMRGFNLELGQPTRSVELGQSGQQSLIWNGRIVDRNMPWVAALVPDGDVSSVCDIVDYRPAATGR